jgi:beta-phosphoglucomutase-like phosphatase (HAD superfamily)
MTTTDYDYMRSGEIVDGALPKASFVFDLDGTLVDSVYQHVLAWRTAIESEGINLSVWRIHRKIGMSGGLFSQHVGLSFDPPPDPARGR